MIELCIKIFFRWMYILDTFERELQKQDHLRGIFFFIDLFCEINFYLSAVIAELDSHWHFSVVHIQLCLQLALTISLVICCSYLVKWSGFCNNNSKNNNKIINV